MNDAAHEREPPDIEALYRRFGPLVLRRGRRFLSRDAAEDVLHEVFVRVLEQFHTFRNEASPATWLFSVTTRLCLNRLRDAKRRGELLAEHGPTSWCQQIATENTEATAFLKEVWCFVLEEDEELAMIGTLYHLDGMTTADIGQMLGVSDRTIANRLGRLSDLVRRHAGEGGTP